MGADSYPTRHSICKESYSVPVTSEICIHSPTPSTGSHMSAGSWEWGVESGEMGFVMVVGRGEWVSGKGGKTLVASWQMFPNLNQIDIGAGAVGAVGVCEGGLVVAWC